jgi:trehalose 6-phosphate phosphatase
MRTTHEGLSERSALFLDFDGTLAELAPRPDAVVVPPDLVAVLQQLHQRLNGALALVTGRAQADIEPMLAPLQLPAAFEHGALRRSGNGQMTQAPTPALSPALQVAHALAAQHPGLLVEQKQTSMALHFRLAPDLETLCVTALGEAIADDPELQLLRGKAVAEVKSARVSKGLAIEAFMHEAPFAGRTPVFAGDDVTDEAGFAVVQRLGGTGIKVGDGPSCAALRMADPPTLRQWLQQAARLPLAPWPDAPLHAAPRTVS